MLTVSGGDKIPSKDGIIFSGEQSINMRKQLEERSQVAEAPTSVLYSRKLIYMGHAQQETV
jgi:hypothetical protein